MKGKVLKVEEGIWPSKKPFWAVSVFYQEGKEPTKLYAETEEIGKGLLVGREYDFSLRTTGQSGQPLKYSYITEAVPVGPSKDEQAPWPGEDPVRPTPKPPSEASRKPAAPAEGTHVPPDARDRLIMRQVALKAAVEDLKGSEHPPGEVIDVAKVFLKWLEE